NEGNDGVSILLGNGDGTFQSPQILATSGGSALALEDFNGDGNLDIALANRDSGTAAILRGRGDGPLEDVSVPRPAPCVVGGLLGSAGAQTPVSLAVAGSPWALVAKEFDGDGRCDLAVAARYANQVTMLRGQGDGTFQLGDSFAVGSQPTALVVGDFNGDGH